MSNLSGAIPKCDEAARAIARLEPHKWPGLILLILEVLDAENLADSTFRATLLQIQQGIEQRLDGGRW